MSGHCPGCGTYCEEDDDRLCGRCVGKEPSVEFEKIKRDLVRKIVDKFIGEIDVLNAVEESKMIEELNAIVEPALRAAATVPAGMVRVGTEDMTLLGTLPVTADRCVVGEHATVWRSAEASITNEVRPEVLVLAWRTWSGQFGNVPGDMLMTKASGWYSTREAAESAAQAARERGGEG
jgi:hypothetical protein